MFFFGGVLCIWYWCICFFFCWIVEKVDSDIIVEEEKSMEDKIFGNVDIKILFFEVEELKLDVEILIIMELEV